MEMGSDQFGSSCNVGAEHAEARAAGHPRRKKLFELPSFTTMGGAVLRQVRVGWESYGTLNEARDNAILVTHFFSANSHAAGKYRPDDAEPGYWNAIIGPGKPLDTNRYCIISSDTLVNLNAKDPNTITTGPATIDPGTGKPYGMSFPIVTIRDFVNVQKALLDHLGIASLQAVVGASMGALQALEWASAYPDRVQRVVAVIGGAEENAFLIGWLQLWAAPIRLDPHWNQGDYYGRVEPTRGLIEALKMVTAAGEPMAVGRPHVRAGLGGGGPGPGCCHGEPVCGRGMAGTDGGRPGSGVRCQPLPLPGQGQPALPDRPRAQRRAGLGRPSRRHAC